MGAVGAWPLRAAGRLHAEDRRRARPALVRRRAVRLAADAQGRVDDPGRRELGTSSSASPRSATTRSSPSTRATRSRSTRPTRPRRRARSTASRPPTAARRDQALRPAGEWNTYEITVDAPRIVVRLNGVVVNRFVSTSAARQSLGRGFVGLQNHSDADRVSFRSVQVKEWAGERPSCPSGTPRRAPSDAFSGARLDGCRWNRLVRYDGGGLDVERRKAAPGAHRRRHPRPQQHGSRQPRAPAGAVRRLGDRDNRARAAPLGLAAGGPAGPPQRRRLRQARRGGGRQPRPAPTRQRGRGRRRRGCSGGDDAAAEERHLPAAPREVGRALHGLVEPRRTELAASRRRRQQPARCESGATGSSRSGRVGAARRRTRSSSPSAPRRRRADARLALEIAPHLACGGS